MQNKWVALCIDLEPFSSIIFFSFLNGLLSFTGCSKDSNEIMFFPKFGVNEANLGIKGSIANLIHTTLPWYCKKIVWILW